MTVFLRQAADPARLPGEFHLVAEPAGAGTQPEKDYAAKLNQLVDYFAISEIADIAANYPARLLAGRQRARQAAMAALGGDADNFIAGNNPNGDAQRVDAIGLNYIAKVPKYGARLATNPRFAGDVDIIVVPGYSPTIPQKDFFDTVGAALRELQADEAIEPTSQFSVNVKLARQKQRIGLAEALIEAIDFFAAGEQPAEAAIIDVILLRGRYQALRDRLTRRLFNVTFEKGGKADAEEVSVGGVNAAKPGPEKGAPRDNTIYDGPPASLEIRLLSDLPPPEDKASPEKLDLYAKINKTNTVIRTVCDRLQERVSQKSGLALFFESTSTESIDRVRKVHLEFLEKLHSVAVIGLELNFVDVAQSTLAELRNEFFALEAGRIKSAHSNGLALVAFLGTAVLLTIYAVVSLNGCTPPGCKNSWLFEHKSFLAAASGAAIGTWASFTYRQVQFTFEDLMMLEERASAPAMRILFVVILAMAACLLFWNGAVNIEVGNLKTEPERFRLAGSVAFVIGLFCGLSERALATAIAGRAAAFVKGVGGA